MLNKSLFLLLLVVCFAACETSDDPIENSSVSIDFSHRFNQQAVTSNNFNALQYTNGFGTTLSLTRLRYLISEISFTNQQGIKTLVKDYQLIDVGENTGMLIDGITLAEGTYSLNMRFGFSETANTSSIYPDLNSASWNVPQMLGGGYHYMQMEGRFLDLNNQESIYAYHTISAVQNPGPDNIREDTSIALTLGEINITQDAIQINVTMDIDQWFENPNLWDLNLLNGMLMGNYTAQKLMQENGQTVFSLQTN
jgi:hypothetical protein